MNLKTQIALGYIFGALFVGCSPDPESRTDHQAEANHEHPLFTQLNPSETGVTFSNQLIESETVNTFNYLNAYNGAGVAVGDINGDALPDLFFTGNTVTNRLYLNKGDLVFEDISEKAGIDRFGHWSTGVTMNDFNNDGFLDIYVCRAFAETENCANLLFINNGDLTFREAAREYGLADQGFSTQATALDYDLDGDLDLFVGNHLIRHQSDHEDSYQQFQNPSHELSDHLYRNDGNGSFTDVTKSAGLLTYGVTLGVLAIDLNEDGWTDIYVANDQQEPDYLFINNQDGTFRNEIHSTMRHITYFSMGLDAGDINNDGHLDLMVLDMLADSNYREKTQMASMNPEKYDINVSHGYHHQFMRNVLQLNNGNGTFSDIAYLAGVSATDWSWSVLLADFDNDTDKDIYISTGIKRDVLDKDFIKKLDQQLNEGFYEGQIEDLLSMIASTPVPNKFFQNNGTLTFTEKTEATGLDSPGFTHGAAYADLDLDGDLDLVTNNMDAPASIYRNNQAQKNDSHYLRIRLKGPESNRFGLGAKVTIENATGLQFQELTLTRGFKSAVEPILHFGLGAEAEVSRIQVEWPDQSTSLLTDVAANQVLEIDFQTAGNEPAIPAQKSVKPTFTEITQETQLSFLHQENPYNDFFREVLLPHKTSQFGPKIAIGDIDGNQLEDVYVGGAAEQAGALYVQTNPLVFKKIAGPWDADAKQEDLGSVFFDADNDGDLDLYVTSGGNAIPADSPLLQDRLYRNDGNHTFTHDTDALPQMLTSGGVVVAEDFDQDGDLDLFVGGRLIPRKYPFPPRSYLLRNDGGRFQDVTQQLAPKLAEAGMVTSALWIDINENGAPDLVVAGEWMPIIVFENKEGKFSDESTKYGFENTTGWWTTLISKDLDKDGDLDLVAGNLGLNYKYRTSEEEPFQIYAKDFDLSGTTDLVLGYYEDGVCVPVRGLQCSSEQIPGLSDKFKTYKDFALASLPQIYGASKLETALHYEAKVFESVRFENKGKGQFDRIPLPAEAQIAPVQGIIADDFDADGTTDLLLAGNFFVSEVETGRADAGSGLFLRGRGDGIFDPATIAESGFYAPHDVRDLQQVSGGPAKSRLILVANNNDRLQVFRTSTQGSE